MKINYLLTAALFASLGLFSCSNDESTYSNDTSVKFNASIEDIKTRVGNSWTGNEKIGLYMLNSTDDFLPISSNKQYAVSVSGDMSATDGENLYYPEDGGKVKFVAYHPHSSIGEDNIYSVDLSAASSVDQDLLYTNITNSYDQNNTDPIQLKFKHQLAKLTLSIKDENGQNLNNFTAKITIPSKANFDISTGTLTVTNGSEKELDMTISNNIASSLAIPGTTGKIVFTSNGKTFTWDMSNITLTAGKNYAYTLKLVPTGVPGNKVEVVGNATIIGWDTINGGDIDVDQDGSVTPDPDPNPNPDPDAKPVYTSNILIPETDTDGKWYKEQLILDGNQYECLKMGTSKLGAKCTIGAIGAGKTKVKFYAYAWKGTPTTMIVTIGNKVETINLEPLDGLTGSLPTDGYPLTLPADAKPRTIEIDSSDDATTITFDTTESKKRAVIFGINVE